jgi:ABC-type transport system involved in multi-copper enzyme maturation permease subunit
MKTTMIVMNNTLKDYLTSLRLLVGFIIVVFLMSSGALIYSQRYQQELQDYRGNLADLDDRIQEESVHLASVVTMELDAYRRPSSLQFVVDGGEETLPNKVRYNVNLIVNPNREGGANYMLPPFEGMDWDFVVRVILSFVAIALTYDAISGERSRGTMRLIMSNPVPRDKLITGKFLAALVAVVLPLYLGALIAVAVIKVYGGMTLDGGEYLRLLIHLSLSTVYIAVFVLIGLIVSIYSRKSSSSLVVLLLIWVCIVIAIPGLARPLAIISRDLSSRKEFDSEVSQILESVLKDYEGKDVSHAPLDVAQVDESEYLWDEMMDKVDSREQDMVDHYWISKMEQSYFARKISMLTPAGLYQFAGQDLVNTGLVRQESFVRSVNSFRGVLADFGRSMDAEDPDSPHILYRTWYMSQRPVDPDIVPRYRDNRDGDSRRTEGAVLRGLWLLAEAFVLFVVAHVSFLRSDVR